ncbi:MAG: endonuclease/exonuclease/phosphatase family protein [Chthoniobacterales bacterium]
MRNPIPKIWRRRIVGTAGLLLAVWAVVAAAGWAGYLGWEAELFANFSMAPVLAAVAAVVLLALSFGRLAAGLGCVAFVMVIGCTMLPKPCLPAGVPAGATVRFATWNACLGGLSPQAVVRWIEANDPDVIAFEEITQKLHGELEKPLRARYPYYLGNPRSGPGGLAIFSKLPITNWQRLTGRTHFASCNLQWPGGPVCKIVIAHTPAPTSGGWYRARADVLHEVAASVMGEPRPLIVLGDFNSTWAVKDFRDFCRVTNLLPATNHLPSWNSALPGWLRIPIDHVLAQPSNFLVVATAAGSEGSGSDHLPVLAEIELRRPSLTAAR